MNKNDQESLVREIRARYTGRDRSELDELKALDKQARRPADIFGWSFGTISALVMGGGMSLIMTDLGQTLGIAAPFVPGLAFGIAGMLMAIANYPVYKKLLNTRRRKYAGEIAALSDRLLRF